MKLFIEPPIDRIKNYFHISCIIVKIFRGIKSHILFFGLFWSFFFFFFHRTCRVSPQLEVSTLRLRCVCGGVLESLGAGFKQTPELMCEAVKVLFDLFIIVIIIVHLDSVWLFSCELIHECSS